MRIDGKPPTSPLSAGALGRGGRAGGRFALGTEASAPSSGARSAAPLSTVDALLALQGEADPKERRRRAVKRGNELLDGLDRLKAALLGGRVPVADLKAMALRLSERREGSDDPALDEILGHIELRAEVELAKLAQR